MLAGDNASPLVHVTREGETRHAIALRGDRLVAAQEREDHVVDALVIGEIDDWARAAYNEQCVISAHRAFGLDETFVVGFKAPDEVGCRRVRPLRKPLRQIARLL